MSIGSWGRRKNVSVETLASACNGQLQTLFGVWVFETRRAYDAFNFNQLTVFQAGKEVVKDNLARFGQSSPAANNNSRFPDSGCKIARSGYSINVDEISGPNFCNAIAREDANAGRSILDKQKAIRLTCHDAGHVDRVFPLSLWRGELPHLGDFGKDSLRP